jgi:hypothetical protein
VRQLDSGEHRASLRRQALILRQADPLRRDARIQCTRLADTVWAATRP